MGKQDDILVLNQVDKDKFSQYMHSIKIGLDGSYIDDKWKEFNDAVPALFSSLGEAIYNGLDSQTRQGLINYMKG
ncbi:hypothetical protein [Parabacteroides bouchesdurhonensis]|uniref:hypothetical protein n=1 Tax=Parabacteroides bouchesdurhonensis TaxID=1936995 RepID=UPI000C83D93F|nr:hypothetical protein [Parabacteroides bouchesdurhonensis]